MSELDKQIEEIKKEIRIKKYNLQQFEEAQIEYKNNPGLYQSDGFAVSINNIKMKELPQLQQKLEKLEKQREKEIENRYEQILGMKITGEHDVELVGENAPSVKTRKSDQELNLEIGKLKIRLNELEEKGQIDEDTHEELLDYMETKYNRIRLENRENLNNNLSPEQQAEIMIQAMANGTLDTNGQPIVQNQEQMNNGRQMGFIKVWMLGIITTIVSIGIVALGIIITK